MAGLARKTEKRDVFCGASLIDRRHVVTAAHCMALLFGGQHQPDKLVVRLGAHNMDANDTNDEPEARDYEVDAIVSHNEFSVSTKVNDIAILRLKSPVVFGMAVRPICLPDPTTTGDVSYANETAVLAGWGKTSETGPDSRVLLEVDVRVWNNTDCNESLGDVSRITDTMVCAGIKDGGKDTCQGDSGGPLMHKRQSDGKWQLIGVVSWGRGCGQANSPGVNTRITRYIDWISKHTNEGNETTVPTDTNSTLTTTTTTTTISTIITTTTTIDTTVPTPAANGSSMSDQWWDTQPVVELCGGTGIGTRIVGGRPAIPNSWPWMAGIVSKGSNKPFCGGTLISRQLVVTAAHCMKSIYGSKQPDNIMIRLGVHDVENTTEPMARDYTVESIIVHKNYTDVENGYDIALIKLKDRVKLSPEVRPICLPASLNHSDHNTYEDKLAMLAGWGRKVEFGSGSTELMEVEVQVWNNTACNESLAKFNIIDSMVCAGDRAGGKDSCQGDSGGPLMYRRPADTKWELIGIVSFGAGCGRENSPGANTRVTHYIDWISDNWSPVEDMDNNNNNTIDTDNTNVTTVSPTPSPTTTTTSITPNDTTVLPTNSTSSSMSDQWWDTQPVDELCGGTGIGTRIVGGRPAIPNSWPWMAGIVSKGDNDPFCGATLISRQLVVTAAHCMKSYFGRKQPDNIMIRLGVHDVENTTEPMARDYAVESITIHKKYIDVENGYDIALIKLKDRVKLSPEVRPICLPASLNHSQHNTYEDKLAMLAGWGLKIESSSSGSNVLMEVEVQVWNNTACNESLSQFNIVDSMLCAGDRAGGKDSCQGDSGGPLMYRRPTDTKWELIGIVSFGAGCGRENSPGANTRVTHYIDWIGDNGLIEDMDTNNTTTNNTTDTDNTNVTTVSPTPSPTTTTTTSIIPNDTIVLPTNSTSSSMSDQWWDTQPIEELCGGSGIGTRIVGGRPAVPNSWPWMAAIIRKESGRLFCGGTLINRYYIVTAAHCLESGDTGHPDKLLVRLGAHESNNPNESEVAKSYAVESILLHGNYTDSNQGYDIAVIKLKDRVRLSPEIRPVCLPQALDQMDSDNDTYDDKDAVLTGWGRTAEEWGGSGSQTLMEVQVQVWNNTACNESLSQFNIIPNMLCAGDRAGGKDSCQGDSGGPLVYRRPADTKWELIGVVSFGAGCGRENSPGVNTRVTHYVTWIKQHSIEEPVVNQNTTTL
ncbi:transmembrane protease serine 9-like [Oppia nitens]|uniref:transmembrane protease serine 9-like n=1 Tax=Oppia nitens TaxID=1686743 RepID=UPI0023DCE7A5|nr:transmembrane protease serine 9-like [Oppia nitens]